MTKRLARRTIITVIAALMMAVIAVLPMTARANAEEFTEYRPVSLSVANSQFSSSSGAMPAAPSSWSVNSFGGAGNAVAGVIDLAPESYSLEENTEAYKLYKYNEYKTLAPQTPFGRAAFPDTDTKALMINTNGADIAYGYSSPEMSFEANCFYRVSIWVKTGNFKSGQGAVIKLTGLEEEIAVRDINTVKQLPVDNNGLPVLNESNNFGFVKYSFYVRTSHVDSTVKLHLQVGDKLSEEDVQYYYPANGYAFFDTLEAHKIDAKAFYHETEISSSTKIVKDFDSTEIFTDASNNDVGSFVNGLNGWSFATVEDAEHPYGEGQKVVYNSETRFDKDNAYGLTEQPWTPFGLGMPANNILLLSSYSSSSKNYNATATGLRGPDFTVERYKFYRFSAWVKTDSLDGGAGATIVLGGESTITADNKKLNQVFSGLNGSTRPEHYGWAQHSIYIRGSAMTDLTLHPELWLGRPDSKSSGVAMFSSIGLEEISYADFEKFTAEEAASYVSLDSSYPSTGVDNGNFFLIEQYEKNDYGFPFAPQSWRRLEPHNVNTSGFSPKEVESSENAVGGIIPTDRQTFDYYHNMGAFLNASNPSQYADGLINVLLLTSNEPTAFGYGSPLITVAADSYAKITVSMAVDIRSGYGANLVLKQGAEVISTIENITDTGASFREYSFYVGGGNEENQLSVEIWLGLNDRIDNTGKLSQGSVYVRSVSFDESDETTLASMYDQIEEADSRGGRINFGIYSFNKQGFRDFDRYDTAFVKRPYNWHISSTASDIVRYGIFNSDLVDPAQIEIPAAFFTDSQSGNVLYLRNVGDAYSYLQSSNSLYIPADSWCRVDITVKTHLAQSTIDSKTAKGLGIHLVGAQTYSFEDIKDTSYQPDRTNPDSRDYEAFRTYSFYIEGGANGGSVFYRFTLGGNEYSNQRAQGRVYISEISVNTITNIDFNDFTELEDDSDFDGYGMSVKLSEVAEPEDDDDETSKEVNWWLIPTIISSVAMLLALGAVAVRKLIERHGFKRNTKAVSDYDRKRTLHKQKPLGEESAKISKDFYEDFDESKIVKAPKPEPKPEYESVPESAPSATEEQTPAEAEQKAQATESEDQDSYLDKFDD